MEIIESNVKRPLISLTSLIDVVFILLVFFMLASSFVNWNYIELGTTEQGSISVTSTEQSLITVGFDQQYQLNSVTMPLTSIVDIVKEQVRKQSDHPIIIQPIDDLPLQQLVIVLDTLGEFAASNISLVKNEN